MSYSDGKTLLQNFGTSPTNVAPSADVNGNQLVAHGLPPYTEMSRLGEGWTIQTTTLFAPLTAIPTTTAILELWNNSVTNGRVMVVRDLFASQVLATAVVQTFSIYAQISTIKTVPSFTALTMFSLTGRNSITTTNGGELTTGIGTTVTANGWRPYGPAQAWGLAAATPGNSWSVPVDGKLIVPVGCSLQLHVMGSLATASSFQVGCTFDWVTGLKVQA